MNNCKNCGANSFLNDTCQYCGSVELKEKKITASQQEIKSNNGVYFNLKNTILTGNNTVIKQAVKPLALAGGYKAIGASR